MATSLIKVKDPGPELQRAADASVPLGWCNVCVGSAKQAMADGTAPEPIHAAVTLVPRSQMIPLPGVGNLPAVFTIPICWAHLEAAKRSSLVEGQAAVPGLAG